MTFRIRGLDPAAFRHLYGRDEASLAAQGVRRMRAHERPGFPDRVGMAEVPEGETVLLLNHVSLAAASPYRASHAIFVREGAEQAYDRVGEVPEVLRRRLLSLRGFDAAGMMSDADIVEGAEVEGLIARLLANPAIAMVHAHYARRGCYAGLITRAG
jgi:hypothetical protein